MKNKFILMTVIFAVLILSSATKAQIASGGGYTLEKAVIASGGGGSVNGIYKTEGTSGQVAAGTLLSNSPYAQTGGFWTPQFAPTAASASVGGRVVAGKNAGVKGAIITLNGGNLTAPRIAITNNFGYFAFTDVEIGHFYILSVRHKKYGFAQDSFSFTLFEDRRGIVFQADWGN